MALTVENGTGLANADSYYTLSAARAAAISLGISLPSDDSVAEAAMRNGFRYVNGFESSFSGYRLTSTQSGSFPRVESYRCYGRNQIDIAEDEIPADIKTAQMMAAVEYGKGTEIMPVNNGLSIASNEVVGAVKQSYFDNGKTGKTIEITQAVDAMASLMCIGGGFTMRTNRV